MESLSAGDLAKQLFAQIRVEPSSSASLPPEKLNRISDELVFLSIFLIDLSVYLSFGDSDRRHDVMNSFWDIITNSGLNTDVLNQRMFEYSGAAKAETHQESLAKIGQTFAWHCLAQDNTAIAKFGERESSIILADMSRMLG